MTRKAKASMSTKHFSVAIEPNEKYFLFSETSLNEMVNAVRAAEREACARVCEDGVQNATDWDSSYWDQACQNRADAIRARGQE